MKHYHRSMVGDMTPVYENVTFPGEHCQTMCVYGVEPNSPSDGAPQLLARWLDRNRQRTRRVIFAS